jgi:hypothetical protein
MVEPKNGRNPLVVQAEKIRLPMPGETDDEDEYEYEDEEWEEVDELREPQSEDEKVNGVNMSPDSGKPRRRRRPPMPSVPQPDEGEVFVPPFEVLPDGTVTGPTIGDASDVLPPGFDPPRGSAEALLQTVYAKPPQRLGGV